VVDPHLRVNAILPDLDCAFRRFENKVEGEHSTFLNNEPVANYENTSKENGFNDIIGFVNSIIS
jgi:hypothetical protein